MIEYFGCFAELNLRVCLPITDCRMRERRIIRTEIRIDCTQKLVDRKMSVGLWRKLQIEPLD